MHEFSFEKPEETLHRGIVEAVPLATDGALQTLGHRRAATTHDRRQAEAGQPIEGGSARSQASLDHRRQRVADIHHHREADDLGRTVEVAERNSHLAKLWMLHLHINLFLSDNALRRPMHESYVWQCPDRKRRPGGRRSLTLAPRLGRRCAGRKSFPRTFADWQIPRAQAPHGMLHPSHRKSAPTLGSRRTRRRRRHLNTVDSQGHREQSFLHLSGSPTVQHAPWEHAPGTCPMEHLPSAARERPRARAAGRDRPSRCGSRRWRRLDGRRVRDRGSRPGPSDRLGGRPSLLLYFPAVPARATLLQDSGWTALSIPTMYDVRCRSC